MRVSLLFAVCTLVVKKITRAIKNQQCYCNIFSISLFDSFSIVCLLKLELQLHCRVGRSKSPKVSQKSRNWKLHVDLDFRQFGQRRLKKIKSKSIPWNCLFVAEVSWMAATADSLWEQGGTLKQRFKKCFRWEYQPTPFLLLCLSVTENPDQTQGGQKGDWMWNHW